MKKLILASSIALLLSACQQTEQKADQTTHDGEVVSTEHAHDHTVADTPAPALEESVYLVGGEWKDQDGNTFDLNSLAGQKQVVAFIFTNCKEVCPFMMRSMKNIQDKLPEEVRANTGFLVVSFDPERDTPAVLKNFGEHYKADEHWTFLNGSDDDVRTLANTMNIRYQHAEGGMINHSNAIMVLDEHGKMIEQANGTSTAGEDAVVAALKQ